MKKFLVGLVSFLAVASIAHVLITNAAANPPALGGTGTTQIPQPGQTLIGNASNTYTPAYIVCSGNCSVATSSGGITISVPTASVTTTINGTQSAAFRIVGDGLTVTSTVSGATTTFSIINTGNWTGTWQGVNSTTFYLASNPNNYISSSTGNTLYYPLGSNPSGYVTSTGYATGSVATLGSPLTVQGNATATIFGAASNSSNDNTSYIPELDRVYSVPLNYATAGCNGSSALTDFGACVNSLYANAPSQPYYVGIKLPCSLSVPSSTWKTPIVFANFGVRPSLFSLCGADLHYGGTGTAITFNFENPTGHLDSQDYGFTVMGHDTLIAAGQTNTATTTGIMCGGTFGCVGVLFHDINVNGTGRNWATGANAYMDTWTNDTSNGGNCGGSGLLGCLFFVPGASNSGEAFALNNFKATDPGNTTSGNAVYLTNGSVSSFSWCGGSLDDAQFSFGSSNGSVSFPCLLHVENSDGSAYGQYIPFLGVSSDLSTSLVINDIELANDFSGANTFGTIIKHGGQVSIQYIHVDNYGGGTISNLVDHSLDNGLSADRVCGVSVQSGGLTNIIAGGGGNTYSQAKGVGCSLNVANSFTINMYPNGNNTNNIDSGNTTVATFDHNGNWALGDGAQFVSADVKGSVNGGIGAAVYLDNRSNTANDAAALYAYDGTSATPIRGAIVWKDGAVGQASTLFYSGNATDTANMQVMGGFSQFNNSVTTQTNFSVGTSSFPSTLFVNDGVNNSSTILIGGSGRNACIEMPDEGAAGALRYVYVSSTALVVTATKPAFCE